VKSKRMILVSLATIGTLVASSVPALRAQDADAVPMSLSECLKIGLEHNLGLAILKQNPKIAEQNVTFQKAAFDPILGAGASHKAARSTTTNTTTQLNPPLPAASTSESAKTITDSLSVNLQQRLNFGATYQVWASGNTAPGNSGEVFIPQFPIRYAFDNQRPYGWAYGFTFDLPLLRGFGKTVNEASIMIATHDLNISNNELRRQSELMVQLIENAYWDLLAIRKAQEVSEQALKLSQDLYELNKKKVEVGTLAPIEITQAEANVASNVEGTIRTKQGVKNAEDNLLRLLAIPESDPLWGKTILPTETPKSEPTTTDTEAAIKTAFERRTEVASARENIEIATLDEKVAKNGVKHGLNLRADWARSHAEASSQYTYSFPAQPPYTVDTVTRQTPDWALSLVYSYPIGNRAAKANYAVSKINAEKADILLNTVLLDVRVDVRESARAVDSGYERVVAARKNVELQQKKLDAEQKKFDNGMSTSFEVFTFQTDLRNAQLSLIQAMLDYNKALADLERAKGTLLESKGLQLADGTAGK
jgi:outer membrane protein